MLADRMLRAAKLDVSLYEEVEADSAATPQALWVVVIASAAGGVGTMLSQMTAGTGAGSMVGGLVVGIISALAFWAIWSLLAYWIGTTFLGGTATYGELLRCIGFADSPGVLHILSFIPVLGGLVGIGVFVWLLIAGVIAVRQALDFTTGKAIVTSLISWVVGILAMGIILALFGLALQ
jgi:hypothetical protein